MRKFSRKEVTRLISEPSRIENAIKFLRSNNKEKAEPLTLHSLTNQELDFEKYQFFYIYQWKLDNIKKQKKILELEEQARKLQHEEFLLKVKEHDEMRA